MKGFVSLVGAGPGDPELLTLKAVRRLEQADVVFYDALVPAAVLDYAGTAQRFYVGKRAGRHSTQQRCIERLLVKAAQRGQRAVRLKCGDPFVLGRGGEEALALADAGVPFEVIPGLSAAVAGPELFGIPLTHRGLAAGFAVISGHSAATYEPLIAGMAPHGLTLVVLMGLAQRHNIAACLMRRGWRAETPAALLLAASTTPWGWSGHLRDIGDAPLRPDMVGAPGLLVFGDVVALQAVLGATSLAEAPVAVRVAR